MRNKAAREQCRAEMEHLGIHRTENDLRIYECLVDASISLLSIKRTMLLIKIALLDQCCTLSRLGGVIGCKEEVDRVGNMDLLKRCGLGQS